MNRTIKDATVKRPHDDDHSQLRPYLADFRAASETEQLNREAADLSYEGDHMPRSTYWFLRMTGTGPLNHDRQAPWFLLWLASLEDYEPINRRSLPAHKPLPQ